VLSQLAVVKEASNDASLGYLVSNVHLLFKRLFFGGCTSGSMRELGCESRVEPWVSCPFSENNVNVWDAEVEVKCMI